MQDDSVVLPAVVTPPVNPHLKGKDWVWAWVPSVWGAGGYTRSMLRTEAQAHGFEFTEPREGQEPRY